MKYRSRKSRLRRRIFWILFAAGLLALLIALYFNIIGVIAAVAEARLRAYAATAVNEAVFGTLSDGVRYSDLVRVERGADGDIQAITANAYEINRIARETAQNAQTHLQAYGDEGLRIPLGAFTGIEAWAGAGPEVTVHVLPVAVVTCDIASAFESAGINQTRHSLYLDVDAAITIVFPGKRHEFSLQTQILIAESVLTGEVPNIYWQGSLL